MNPDQWDTGTDPASSLALLAIAALVLAVTAPLRWWRRHTDARCRAWQERGLAEEARRG